MNTTVFNRGLLRRLLRGGRGGFAILTVVFVIVSFAVLGVAAVSMIAGSSRMVIDNYQSAQAFYVAEAGVAYVAEQLAADGDWSDNTGFTKNFGPGSFTVSFLNQGTDAATLEVAGAVGGITRRVQQQLSAGGFAAFSDAIYSVGSISVSGSASGTVTGSITAGGSISNDGGVLFDGDVDDNHETAAIPIPDWDYWQNIADHVIAGSYNFSSGTYDGIYYITESVTINRDVTINGTLVVRGSISCAGNGNVSIIAAPGNPAILTEESLNFSGTSDLTIQGWVFAVGSASFTGNSDITIDGGVTAGGSLSMSGNTDVGLTFNESLAPGAGFSGGERGGVTLGVWREAY